MPALTGLGAATIGRQIGNDGLHEKRDELNVKNCVFPNSELDDVNMSNTHFNNINLSVARITRANLTNARIDDANMANITINDVNLSNGRITNANLSNLAIQDCLLVGMTINGIPVQEMLAAYRAAKG